MSERQSFSRLCTAFDSLSETALRIADEHERLRLALNGLVGLTELLLGRDDLPAEVREALETNHRVVEAREALDRTGALS